MNPDNQGPQLKAHVKLSPEDEANAAAAPKAEFIFKEPEILEQVDNSIYYYSEVNRSSTLKLNKTLASLSNSHIASQLVRHIDKPDHIELHISSYGGNLFDGLSSMDQILNIGKKVPITTIVDGCAASAATFLTMVGNKRLMNEHSFMLIHQLSSIAWGNYAQLKDDQANNDRLMKMIYDVYDKYTKVPKSEIEQILEHDLWWDAEKCLEMGLVDEII